MDNVLGPYVTAKDEREREQHLDELLTFRAAPMIRQVLRRRLGFYVSAQGLNKNNQDAQDLYQEAMTRVLHGLNQLRSSSPTDIANFELYVSRVAANLCTDFLRASSPARTRLKYSLRDLIKRHKELATWEWNGEVLCGLAIWRGAGKSPISEQPFPDIEMELTSFRSIYFEDDDVRIASLSRIVADLFDWIRGPVDIDVLVQMIAHLLDVKEREMESLDDPSVARHDSHFTANTQSNQSHIEANELLATLWRALIRLPAGQRDAFALSFKDDADRDLFTVLLAAGITGWDEIANGMGRSTAEVVRLRLRMPMDTASIAAELRVSRQNVHKWRFRAIRRLKTELGQ